LDAANANAVWRRTVTRFALGQFAEAAQDAERSVRLNPDWGYGILWRYIANVKSGTAKPGVLPYSGKIDESKWPGPVLALYMGVLTAEQVSDAAVKAGGGKAAPDMCEATRWRSPLGHP
jgi:hypothetical protein